MMRLSHVAQILGGRLVGEDVRFAAVSTDSRNIVIGDLFVALRGENFDGAKFIVSAVQDGAVAALVNSDSYLAEGSCPKVLVEDTRLALGKLAAHWRKQFSIPLVGITGSNGKTTVKEMLTSILREQTGDADLVLSTQGNLNNDIGLPLTLLKLRTQHRYAVIEMGMNHTGEIDYLTHIAAPDVAVVNNAGSAHLAGLGSVEAVARAKGEIFAGLNKHGTAIINADDDYVSLWGELAGRHRQLTFGIEHSADISATWQVQGYGSRIEVKTTQGRFSTDLQVPGEHNVRNALAASAAALALHVPTEKITTGLNRFGGVAGRLQRKTTKQGAILIDDTYNANPASLHAALAVLARASGRKILVLGDMGELGPDAAHFHAEIGVEARSLGIQALLALGDLSAYAVDEFGEGAKYFKRIEDLLSELDLQLDSDCTLLVKGSRFMKMERVVQHCAALQ
jgi:UDP-N-acetylmuramoyl-tripeptide--D-alanyl-D-alanine ligase